MLFQMDLKNNGLRILKNSNVLILLLPMIKIWSPEDWLVEKLNDSSARQMSLF